MAYTSEQLEDITHVKELFQTGYIYNIELGFSLLKAPFPYEYGVLMDAIWLHGDRTHEIHKRDVLSSGNELKQLEYCIEWLSKLVKKDISQTMMFFGVYALFGAVTYLRKVRIKPLNNEANGRSRAWSIGDTSNLAKCKCGDKLFCDPSCQIYESLQYEDD